MLALESYAAQNARWPQRGRHVLAHYDDESVPNLAAFPSEDHFVSWLRLCPRTPVSGGKPLKKKISGLGANRVAAALRMAASTVQRSKTALGAAYRRISRHKGAGVAVFATARQLARLVYRMLRFGQDDKLTADHRQIDPILDRGDHAFAQLPLQADDARAVIAELTQLLDAHLELEEQTIVPHLRVFKEFPPPANDAEAQMYAEGFAWATYGIAPAVLDKVNAMLAPPLLARLPAARVAFEARWHRVWGDASVGPSTTSRPDVG